MVVVGGVTRHWNSSGSGTHPSKNKTWSSFQPLGKTFATDLGPRGHSFQTDISCTPAMGRKRECVLRGCFCHKQTLCLSYK